MTLLTDRYAKAIVGVISCWDRLVITGTLPGVCHAAGMEAYLRAKGIRLFDYPRFAEPLRDEIRSNAERVAAEAGVTIEFVRSVHSFRKEDRVRAVLAKRGDAPGLVHILSAMEPCTSFEGWHDKKTGKTTLRYRDGKCLHYYFYFIDATLGLCYLRVPTWAPFRLQFYCNGHNWLASSLSAEGVAFARMDNALVACADCEAAQRHADAFPVERLHRILDGAALRFCPAMRHFPHQYHWSIMQAEYATDIIFRRQHDLKPLYEALVRTAIHAVKPDNVATFLGRKLHPNYEDELGNNFHTRIEGTRIKHHMGPASIKMYDKQGIVLRIETTVNDVTFFKHYRKVEHRTGPSEMMVAPMQKTIYSLPPLREILHACNRRYLEFLSELVDPSAGQDKLDRLTQPVRHNDRNYPGFTFFDNDDAELFRAILRGQFTIAGIHNRSLRAVLGKTSPQISRLLKRLRLHGLIKKVGRRYRYYLTRLGREVALAASKLRELVLIPQLAGIAPA
jgi:hypothetical protein